MITTETNVIDAAVRWYETRQKFLDTQDIVNHPDRMRLINEMSVGEQNLAAVMRGYIK